MKKYTLLALSVLSACRLEAQVLFKAKDAIDVNKINASVLVHGDMWWDPDTYAPACNFPAASKKSIGFVGGIWMSGYDAASQLHIAAQTYRQNGSDWWPGPLDATDTLTYATSYAWAKIWKVNRSDINSFLGTSPHTATNTPYAILTWPGKGNVDAKGNAGTPLTITTGMAPFVDVNGNGAYEPLLGEYPDIKGDQALWWVFSDNGPSHNETDGKPIGVEVHAMAYGYNRGTLIDNVVYYDFKFTNHSPNNYINFRFALRNDVDLGYFLDDFIGFDSSRRMGIAYNGIADDGLVGGHPENSYGRYIPMAGVTMVEMPGDAGTTFMPCGSFMYYNNDASILGNPSSPADYNNYMRSLWRDNTHLKNSLTGLDCNYVFPGDPSNSTQWSECVPSHTPGDRRYILASNDFTFNAGTTQHIAFALVATDPDTTTACGTAVNFNAIKTVADTAWNAYYNPPPPLPAAVAGISKSDLQIFPNPANDKIFIKAAGRLKDGAVVVVYNTMGQIMDVIPTDDGGHISVDISCLPVGVYSLLYRNSATSISKPFIKNRD
jgi:hypothetical protein